MTAKDATPRAVPTPMPASAPVPGPLDGVDGVGDDENSTGVSVVLVVGVALCVTNENLVVVNGVANCVVVKLELDDEMLLALHVVGCAASFSVMLQ